MIDYYNTTQGILNNFNEDKAFTAEEFATINSQCVLLWNTDRFTFSSGQKADFQVSLSRFGDDQPFSGELSLSIVGGPSETRRVDSAGFGVISIANWSIELPSVTHAQPFLFTAVLTTEQMTIRNEWRFWIIPRISINNEKEIYIHYLSRYLFSKTNIPLRHFTIPIALDEKHILVSSYLYKGMLQAVQNGTVLLFLANSDTFRETCTKNSFKAPWWEPQKIWYLNHSNNEQITGLTESHPAMPFHTDGCWDFPLFDLVEQAHAVDIDALELDVKPIVYGVDNRLHRRAYLFEIRLGKGGILVSTLNMDRISMSAPNVAFFSTISSTTACRIVLHPQRNSRWTSSVLYCSSS